MKRKMYMFDFARLRTFHREEFTCLLTLLGRLGYTELGLYLEGAFVTEQYGGAVREKVITPEDAAWILAEAGRQGMTVLPMTNVLYHMEHWLCQERYAHLRRTGPHERYLINFEDPAAIFFALTLIRSLANMFQTKTVHIGLDEFPFTPEEVPAIGAYIAAVTGQMMSEGLSPAVWGDMFWIEQSLTSYLPRETEIFDWNYYGHRPESLRYFRKEGFRQVIAVPSDNGWEGFTGCQRASGYLGSRTDIRVDPGEIEAFLKDGEDEHADGGMIANWGSTAGCSVWAELVPAARAGLWMQGKWDATAAEETQVEAILFGRITPYTQIVHNLRRLQMHVADKCHIRLPQDGLYRMECMKALVNKPADFWADTIALYTQTLPGMEQALVEWIPQNLTERYAHAAMKTVVTNVRASLGLMMLSQCRTVYRQAALLQFSNSDGYCECLVQVEETLDTAVQGLRESRAVREAAIADTGITRQDLFWQDRLVDHLLGRKQQLQAFRRNRTAPVSLPCFTEFLYAWEFAEGGLVAQ